MDFRYQPPTNDFDECTHLENNFRQCLHEKSFQDQLPERKCNIENTLWFMLKCPSFYESYRNVFTLKTHFVEFYEENDLNEARQLNREWVPTPNREEKFTGDFDEE